MTTEAIAVPPVQLNITLDLNAHLARYRHGVGPDGEGGEQVTVEDLIIEEAARQLLSRHAEPHGHHWREFRTDMQEWVERTVRAYIDDLFQTRLHVMVAEATHADRIHDTVQQVAKELLGPKPNGRGQMVPATIDQIVGEAVIKQLQAVGKEAVEQVRAAALAEGSKIASASLVAAAQRMAGQ